MTITYPAVKFKGGGKLFQAPLLEDGCMKNSSGIRQWCCSFCTRSDNYNNGNRRTALHDDVTNVIFSNI